MVLMDQAAPRYIVESEHDFVHNAEAEKQKCKNNKNVKYIFRLGRGLPKAITVRGGGTISMFVVPHNI